jgi:hypothetical protein
LLWKWAVGPATFLFMAGIGLVTAVYFAVFVIEKSRNHIIKKEVRLLADFF